MRRKPPKSRTMRRSRQTLVSRTTHPSAITSRQQSTSAAACRWPRGPAPGGRLQPAPMAPTPLTRSVASRGSLRAIRLPLESSSFANAQFWRWHRSGPAGSDSVLDCIRESPAERMPCLLPRLSPLSSYEKLGATFQLRKSYCYTFLRPHRVAAAARSELPYRGRLRALAAIEGDGSIAGAIRRRHRQDDVRLVRSHHVDRDGQAGERSADAAPAATDVRRDLKPLVRGGLARDESVARRQPDLRIGDEHRWQTERVVAEVAPRRPVVSRGQKCRTWRER